MKLVPLGPALVGLLTLSGCVSSKAPRVGVARDVKDTQSGQPAQETTKKSQTRQPPGAAAGEPLPSALVVEGDLSQSLGKAVAKCEVHFRLAPLDGYRVILKVDERDDQDVAASQHPVRDVVFRLLFV